MTRTIGVYNCTDNTTPAYVYHFNPSWAPNQVWRDGQVVAEIVGDEPDLHGYTVRPTPSTDTIFAVFTQAADPQRAWQTLANERTAGMYVGFDWYPVMGGLWTTIGQLLLTPIAYWKWRGMAQFVVLQAFRDEAHPAHYHLPSAWMVRWQILWARVFGFIPVLYEWGSGEALIRRFL